MGIFYLLMPLILIGCGGAGAVPQHSTGAIPVYNQAYQENYHADTIDDILRHARNAYVLVDPFGTGVRSHIGTIQSKGNEVAGYISAGTGEDWREDFTQLKPYLTTKAWPEWPGEYFVSETDTGILPIMKKRIDKMAAWGLDWIEFDNMDWLNEESRNKYGLKATVAEANTYINALCTYAHSKDMKCMAKNTVEGFEKFDGVLYESYSDNKNWWDQAGLQHFLQTKKLVIINHYNESDCDTVYDAYKSFYGSSSISFICEDKNSKKYKHYNQHP